MSQKNNEPVFQAHNSGNQLYSYLKVMVVGLLAGLLTLMASVAVLFFFRSSAAPWLGGVLNGLFGLSTQQDMWYITRAAGLMAYLLLWFSTAWGLAVSSKILDKLLHRSFTYDFHEFISLLAIGFLALHIIVLTLDQYLPYTFAQILFPFLSPYRPVWVGLGVIAFYLTLLVTITFYIKSKIGMRAFRAIHVLSLVGYFMALVHAFFSGTDSPLIASILMYGITSLSIVFLFSYWLIVMLQKKAERSQRLAAGQINSVPEQR